MKHYLSGFVLTASCCIAACGHTSSPAPSSSTSAVLSTPPQQITQQASEPVTASSTSVHPTTAQHTTYPFSLNSCGRSLTFKQSPQRVVSIGFATVPTLIDLGLESRVAGLTQEIPANTYPPEMEAKMKAMPMLASKQRSGGGVEVSTETILDAKADMTVGPDRNMDWDALANAGVQAYTQAGYCRDKTPKTAELSDIHALYDEMGQIFDVPEAAARAKEALDKRIMAVKRTDNKTVGTAAVLYVTPGEATVWTYGTASMANVIMNTAGLKNIYDNKSERVFEVNLEDLLNKNPDHIILVNIGYEDKQTIDAFTSMANMKELKAVKNNKIMVMPFAWTDPASSLVVNGIEKVSAWLKTNE